MQPGVSQRQQAAADYARRNTLNNHVITSMAETVTPTVIVTHDEEGNELTFESMHELRKAFPYETFAAYNQRIRLAQDGLINWRSNG